MVLGGLPLGEDVTNLNVFGWASTNPIFGGSGSGGSDSSTAVGILQGLEMGGYTLNAELTEMYTTYRAERVASGISNQVWTLSEPPASYYTDELINSAKEFSDVAVVVISRSGGEGADLPMDMSALINGQNGAEANASSVAPANYNYFNAVYENNGPDDDFDEGEHFLELSKREEEMLGIVTSNFENVIVIINANNTMELGCWLTTPRSRPPSSPPAPASPASLPWARSSTAP